MSSHHQVDVTRLPNHWCLAVANDSRGLLNQAHAGEIQRVQLLTLRPQIHVQVNVI